MGIPIIVMTVPDDLARFADKLGNELAQFREQRGSAHNNNLKAIPFERRVAMNVLGTRGEAGLYFFFGGKQGGAVWDVSVGNNRVWGNTPDIVHQGQLYDAKAIDRNDLSLCVYPAGVKPAWRYVLVGVEFWPSIELLGWCTGADVLTTPIKEKVPGRPAYFIEQGEILLRSCDELMEKTDGTT